MSRRRSRNYTTVRVYAEIGQAVVRLVFTDQAEAMLRRGSAVAMYGANDAVIGIRLQNRKVPDALSAIIRKRFDERQSQSSCAAFSSAEVSAIAGTNFPAGKSRTARMSEEEKADRIRRRWCPEDLVESATEKLRLYRGTH